MTTPPEQPKQPEQQQQPRQPDPTKPAMSAKSTNRSLTATRDGDDIPAILTDLVLIFVFAAIGRAQHGESLEIGDLAYTALPFWVGSLIGHVILRFAGKNPRSLTWGSFLVVATWALGQLGRIMLTEGTDPAFLAVSAAFIALFLLGWRLLLMLVERLRTRSRP